ncbi:hypothetical protein [Natronobeatus ordinarius]|uniref:hypothetical protein n=1 Tax=Natronobeatus ordinarius TaxID=2963433 RepID=UPI0020CDDA0A|nr:hypothetical protein [Natronobeatus ordinarius]
MRTVRFDTDDAEEPTPDDDTVPADEHLELAARAELLAEENSRLREEYVRARRAQYRNTALGLAGLGVVAGLGGLLVPGSREVLFVLAATGLFGGLLTYSLTPGRFVAAEVSERVYAGLAANQAALAAELGLREERVYFLGEGGGVRLFVPRHREYDLPDADAGPIVADERSRGLVLEPTGDRLVRELERGLPGELAGQPAALAAQLADGLVEQLELARSAEPDVDPEAGRVTVALVDPAFGPVDRFDHPVASFFAVGVATGLDRPISLEVDPGDDRADWLVTCRLPLEE